LQKNNKGYCIVCYADFGTAKEDPQCEALQLECGHQFCLGCWTEYLAEQVQAGSKACTTTRCQQVGCNMVVPHSFFMECLKDHPLLIKYKRWLCLSFTEENQKI